MRRSQTALSGALLLALIVFATGCGGTKLVPVEGTVTVASQPVKKGTVTFHPDKEGGNTQAYPTLPNATTDDNGKYSLATNGKPGAPPGKYKVTVTSTAPSDPKDPYSIPKHLIDSTNSVPETTTIKIEVKADAPAGAYDVTLKK
jgi:hypothetical protein